MLRLYLQENSAKALKELLFLCSESFKLEWETRVEAVQESCKSLISKVKWGDLPALFIMNDNGDSGLDDAVKRIREESSPHYLVFSLDNAADALRIHPPFYRLSGFLLKPFERDSVSRLVESIYADFSSSNVAYSELFKVKVRGTVYPVPYKSILFFESNNKKIIARTEAQEYEFYASLDEISSSAPKNFKRVHKSFCVNMEHVKAVKPGEKLLTLSDDSQLPFSRTYKSDLLKILSGR